MNLPDIPLFTLLKQQMSWLDARQNVLSQNVANVDTPGYTAQDLKPVDFEQTLRDATQSDQFAGALATDNPRHIALSKTDSGFDGVDAPDVESNPSGNSVSLEDEMIKVSETQAQYQAAANLYAKAMNMMKTAIGHSGS